MRGLKIQIEVPYFASFRRPTSTSTLLTSSIPPFTTIRGMISNAMGLPRDDLRLQDREIKIGIRPTSTIEVNREMAKILKLKGGEKPVRVFSSSPVHREFLVESTYYVYIVGSSNFIKEIEEHIKNPLRPLYIGTSDNFVDICVEKSVGVTEKETTEVNSVIEGIFEGCKIEKIPYRFNKKGRNYSVEYKTVSIPKDFPYKLEKPISAWDFKREKVLCM